MSKLNFSLALFLMVPAGSALATVAAGTGVITFSGAITEPGCAVQQEQNQISATCYRDSQLKVSPISLQANGTLPSGIARIDVEWLDQARRQGILIVNYR